MTKDLYIDLSHMAYRFLFANINDINAIGMNLLRHMLIKNGILYYIEKFKPDRCFVCFDSKGSNWRYKYLPTYKGQRKENREKHDIDWTSFFNLLESFHEELRDFFPIYSIKYEMLEADDMIAHLVRKNLDNNKIIVTSDGDYVQLLKYKNTKLYDPIKNQWKTSERPRFELEKKILMGDKSDNIPSIRPRCGEKTAEKLIESGELEELLNTVDSEGKPSELKRNYDRNKKLIDLDQTPQELIEEFEGYLERYTLADTDMLFQYVKKFKLRELLTEISAIRNKLSNLIR